MHVVARLFSLQMPARRQDLAGILYAWLMKIDRAGAPFIVGALAPAAVLAVLRKPGYAAPFAALAGFMAYFFRDPDRRVPSDPFAVVSPADGRVMVAGPGEPDVAPPGNWKQVSIFLSPVDVHINRIPFGGRVTRIEYQPGQFLPAYKAESGAVNERNEVWIERDGRTIVARQVVGVLARRIVCRITAGDEVATGQRFGLMKFGSRMDVFMPPEARLIVAAGEKVRGGESILARFEEGR
jgi:phosphatidylserine decarboxylase